jgi:HK97 family phage major capsid protein
MPVLSVPFQTSLPYQLSGSSMKWVGENSPKPATKLGFGKLTLTPTKASGIIVVTAELMKLSMPGSENVLQQILLNELVAFTDGALLSAAAATAASPAGILNGVTVSASIAATISAFFTARPNAIAPTWIVSPANVAALSAIDPHNVPTQFKGYPLVLSPAAGPNLILLDPPVLVVADDGLELDITDQAMVEMNDAAAPATATTLYSSLWQENLVGIRVERFVNWKAAANSVQFTATLT